jgi:holo-[acyl-carrier-protein] synthase
MIGLDILHLPRIQSLLLKRATYGQRFIRRILHPNESKLLPTEPTSLVRYLATRYFLGIGCAHRRFAAKEAAYKAFQPDRKVTWKDLEVWKHASGTPFREFSKLKENRICDAGTALTKSTIHSR